MSRIRNVPLHAYGWEMLSRAEARQPHPPTPMRSAQSKPPVFMWSCDYERCGAVAYTYDPRDEAPICTGGAKWSFETRESAEP